MKTPILVGAGQFCQNNFDPELLLSPVGIAAEAALNAINDTGAKANLAGAIDTIAWVRTFADSSPQFPSKLGAITNPPRSLARRIKADPVLAIHTEVGGNTPQTLVNKFSSAIAGGEMELALLVGAEAIANETYAVKNKISADWSEDIEGQLEDRGLGFDGLATPCELMHGVLNSMPLAYTLFENAIRFQMGHSLAQHAEYMATLMDPFVKVAKENPYSMMTEFPSHAELTARDKLLTTSYHKEFCAREKVNLGAAVIMTSVEKAKELGIPEDKWIYLHEGVDVKDHPITGRENFYSSASLNTAAQHLISKGVNIGDIDYFDIYSCFPSAVQVSLDALGMDSTDSRALTLTGGLPYFGGPGNNYSMHGIAEMIHTLRAESGAQGLVVANGGMLSKQSLGVYSATPPATPWKDSAYIEPDANVSPQFDDHGDGEIEIETYAVQYSRGKPVNGVVVGRLKESNVRSIGAVQNDDEATFKALLGDDIIGTSGKLTTGKNRNTFAF